VKSVKRVSLPIIAAMITTAGMLNAQTDGPPSALLSPAQVNTLCKRSVQLMDAGGVVVADLGRASTPVIENVRQACTLLEGRFGAGQLTYSVLMNLRAYLTLAESVPRPFPFPEAASAQLAELREAAARLDAHFRALLDSKDAALQSPDPDNLARWAEANRLLPPPDPSRPRVVLLGDSITEGWRINEYFPDKDFVNRGISGQTTGEMLGRMKADVIDLKPAVVAILGGTNDLARNVPLAVIENNLAMMADLAAANGIRAVLSSVLPVSDVHKRVNPLFEWTPARPPVSIKALNEWLQRFCAQRKLTYLDYFNALRDDSGTLTEDLSDDGLHPNGKGYRIMAPLLEEAAGKVVPRPAPLPVQPAKPQSRK
jgi:lysophospholipase L1-like esterase